jgi:hypothetical protein
MVETREKLEGLQPYFAFRFAMQEPNLQPANCLAIAWRLTRTIELKPLLSIEAADRE